MYPPSVPLIGIASQKLNLPREFFSVSAVEENTSKGGDFTPVKSGCQESDGDSQVYTTPRSVHYDNPRLPDVDPNHSHFFFVGPKKMQSKANFADENMFRRNFEVRDGHPRDCFGMLLPMFIRFR